MKKFNCFQAVTRFFIVFISINMLILGCGPSLSQLVKQKNYDEVKIVLEKGSDPDKFDKEIGYPLQMAIKQKDIPMIELLLKNGADVNLSNPILKAIYGGDIEIIKILIKNGAKLNHSSQLSAAIRGGDIAIIEILVKNGAYINAFFVYNSYKEIKHHGSSSFTEKTIVIKGTPLIEALYFKKNDEIVRFLIKNGANVNTKDSQGKTPLVFAVEQKKTDLVKYLLEKGADPNDKYTYISEKKLSAMAVNMGIFSAVNTYSKRTVMELAISKGYSDIVELLKQFGAKN